MFSRKSRAQSLTLNKTLAAYFLVSVTLLSGPLASAASWKFEDLSTPADPHGACAIYVDDSEGKTDLRLQIVRAKGGVGPAEVFVKETKQFSPAYTWIASPLTNQTMGFIEISRTATERVFWHPPVNTQAIVDHLVADKELKITATGVAKKLETSFSRSGFAKALKEIQNRCLGGQPLVESHFERIFLKDVIVAGDLRTKSGAPGIELRELLHAGFQTYLAQGANNQKINQVIARYKTTIDEYNINASRIQVLTQTEIPNLQTGIAQQKSNRANAEAELKRVTAAIPGLEQTVIRDQAVLDRARAARAPHEAENSRLVNILNQAQSDLSSAQMYESQVRSDIASANRDLNDANNELNSLRNNMSNLQWRVRQADDEVRQARMERDRFNANAEIRRRTENNPRIQQKRNEIQTLQSQMGSYQAQANQAQNELSRAQGALQQCQATPGADCSSQAAQVQSAQNQYYQANAQLQNAQSQLRNAENELQRLISQIENEVRNEEQRLNRRVDRAVDDANRARRDVDQANYRMRDLEMTIIPNLQRELRTLDANLRTAQNNVARARSEVNSADADLQSWRRSVDWSGKTTAIQNASAVLSRSTAARDDAYDNKANQERIIVDSNATQRDLESTLIARTNELSQLRSRQAQLQPTMDRYAAERATFDAEAARLERLMTGYQSQYEAKIES